jgi:hypothetical protein
VSHLAKKILDRLPELDDIEGDLEATAPLADATNGILEKETSLLRRSLTFVAQSLNSLINEMRGDRQIQPDMQDIVNALLKDRLPEQWRKYPCPFGLEAWISDLCRRVDFFNTWVRKGKPMHFDLRCFADPAGFIRAAIHRHVRLGGGGHGPLEFEAHAIKEPVEPVMSGFVISGLKLEGGQWSDHGLIENEHGTITPAPMLHLIPVAKSSQKRIGFYQCPLLAVLRPDEELEGKFTELIQTIPMTTLKSDDFWVIRGASLLIIYE